MKSEVKQFLEEIGIDELRPAQKKAIKAGVLNEKNVLVCTPTASGKTLIAEMAMIPQALKNKKTVYVVPLKALATEKFRSFKKRHTNKKIRMSIGDYDDKDTQLAEADVIIATAEKLDSLMRHNSPWINSVGLVVIDEIHLLNDAGRGPTLEILITMLKRQIKPQILALSATIGNPQELAGWLEAQLVEDTWRPVRLDKGVYYNGEIEFPTQNK